MSRLQFALVLSLVFFLTACLTPPQPALSEVENDLSEGGLLNVELSVDPVAETITLASVNGRTGSELELEGYLDRYDLNFGVQSFSFDKESNPKTLTVNAVLTNKRDYGFWGFVVNASPLYEINSRSNFQDVQGMLLDLNYDGTFRTITERLYQRPNDFIAARINRYMEPVGGTYTKLPLPLQVEFTSGSRFAVRIVVEAEDELVACLSEVATAQEVYYIDNFTYTDHETLFANGRPPWCEGVEFDTVELNQETGYLIVGSLGSISYQLTARDGIIGAPKDSVSTRITDCLYPLFSQQEYYYEDNLTFTDHETLFGESRPRECDEAVKIETVEVSANDYLIVGSLNGLSYPMRPGDGIIGAPRVRSDVVDCLAAIFSRQRSYERFNSTYLDHETILGVAGRLLIRQICEDVVLETVRVTDSDYLITGSLEDLSYQITPSGGVEQISN